jgi:hypothetical protein
VSRKKPSITVVPIEVLLEALDPYLPTELKPTPTSVLSLETVWVGGVQQVVIVTGRDEDTEARIRAVIEASGSKCLDDEEERELLIHQLLNCVRRDL